MPKEERNAEWAKTWKTCYKKERIGNTFAVSSKLKKNKEGIEPVLGADGKMLTDAERRQNASFFSKILNSISLIISSMENYLKTEKHQKKKKKAEGIKAKVDNELSRIEYNYFKGASASSPNEICSNMLKEHADLTAHHRKWESWKKTCKTCCHFQSEIKSNCGNTIWWHSD